MIAIKRFWQGVFREEKPFEQAMVGWQGLAIGLFGSNNDIHSLLPITHIDACEAAGHTGRLHHHCLL